MRQAVCVSAFVLSGLLSTPAVLAQSPSVTQQLVGQWQGFFAESDQRQMGVLFTSNGKAIITFAEMKSLMGMRFTYKLDPQTKPMQIDFGSQLFETPVLTILELPNAQTLNLQLQGTNPGKERPTEFKDTGKFEKIAEGAIAPLTKLSEAEKSKDGEGLFVMTTLARSALLYNLATDQFPTTLEQLGLSNSSTQNYRFQLATQPKQGNQPAHLTLIARAKKPEFKSFISIVLRHDLERQGKTDYLASARVCQSVRPSAIAPANPKIIAPDPRTFSSYEITCGSGSEAVQF